MAQQVIQTAFHAGELAPQLYARVDLQKYHSAAATMRNFFVDYRGGASTRTGTKFILQCYKSSTAVRLITFQASFLVNYVLEFGDQYIRFYNNGAPILEATKAITGATQANPCVVTSNGHGYNVGDWVYITGVVGMTQLNGKYYRVIASTTNTFSLGRMLDGANVNSGSFTAYSSQGTVARVYTLPSPYLAADLALLKFAQDVNTMILCHSSYVPYVLTIVSANNWTLSPISFGTTVPAPGAPTVSSTLGAGTTVNYAYVVSSEDLNNQESAPSAVGTKQTATDLRTTAGTNVISWSAVAGAISYNVYKAQVSYAGAIPSGDQFGFIGNVTGTSIADSNIAPDFSQVPQVAKNPFQGAGVQSVTVTAPGTYTSVPTVTFGAAPAGGVTAQGSAVLQVQGTPTVGGPGAGFVVGDICYFGNGVALVVATVSGGQVTSWQPVTFPNANPGAIGIGSTPTNPVQCTGTNSAVGNIATLKANLTWGVGSVQVTQAGAGYASAPSVTFGSGAATATSTLFPSTAGNPSVPAFFQQRLVLASTPVAFNVFYMSQPGASYNFNVTNPVQADNAITGYIRANKLNTIKAMVPFTTGLLMLTDQQAWIINGGSGGAVVTPIDISAQGQAYNGICDVPPLTVNFDLLYVQAKGSIVRDLTYNFYTNIFTGTDITVLSCHLFFGYQIKEWAYAEEPFKVVWAVRNDGTLLSLTFLKEQEIIGWAHHDTNGTFQSVCSVVETVTGGNVDAVYVVVQRTVNGSPVQYIERMADRFIGSYNDSSIWCVDAGVQYSGSATATISGFDHLIGMTVTGLANGSVIPPTVVAADGTVTLGATATLATIGLAYTPQLQTLPLDLGEPTVQGKRKKITGVSVRCQKTLGLSIGKDSSSLVNMDGLILGNVNEYMNAVVTDLVTADARTITNPLWDVPGQYFIQQSNPYPATILGVIPEVVVGDTPK